MPDLQVTWGSDTRTAAHATGSQLSALKETISQLFPSSTSKSDQVTVHFQDTNGISVPITSDIECEKILTMENTPLRLVVTDEKVPPKPAPTIEQLPGMVADLRSSDARLQLEGMVGIRRLLSIERNPPIQEVIATGIVPRLIELLTLQDYRLVFEAAWALTNIASGTSAQTQEVIDKGAVPVLLKLLSSPNGDVLEQAIWALGNIAGDSTTSRDFVLQHGVMAPLLTNLQEGVKLSILRRATKVLSNLCRGKRPRPPFELVKVALPTLARLILASDEEVLTDACWAISYLSDGSNDKIQAVIEAGVCRRLVELLIHPSHAVQVPALRSVGNIVTGDDLQTQFLLNSNASALPNLLALLSSPKNDIKKEAPWTISNITAGNKPQIQAVIDANIIPPLVTLLQTASFDIQKEVAWAISNATHGSPEQIRYLVSQSSLEPLCDMLSCSDERIASVCLEAVENILRVGGIKDPKCNEFVVLVDNTDGLDNLSALKDHQNNSISTKAGAILTTFFGNEDRRANIRAARNSHTFDA